jgi:hypothetical protein
LTDRCIESFVPINCPRATLAVESLELHVYAVLELLVPVPGPLPVVAVDVGVGVGVDWTGCGEPPPPLHPATSAVSVIAASARGGSCERYIARVILPNVSEGLLIRVKGR